MSERKNPLSNGSIRDDSVTESAISGKEIASADYNFFFRVQYGRQKITGCVRNRCELGKDIHTFNHRKQGREIDGVGEREKYFSLFA